MIRKQSDFEEEEQSNIEKDITLSNSQKGSSNIGAVNFDISNLTDDYTPHVELSMIHSLSKENKQREIRSRSFSTDIRDIKQIGIHLSGPEKGHSNLKSFCSVAGGAV